MDTIYTPPPVDPSIDVVSFDCYGTWDACYTNPAITGDRSVARVVQDLEARFTSASQRVMLLPQACVATAPGPTNGCANNASTEADLVALADKYYQLAQTDPLIAGLMLYMWGDGSGWVGTGRLPNLRAKWATLGAIIVGPRPDGGAPDAGGRDAGSPDAGSPDAGRLDAGAPDAGAKDGGEGSWFDGGAAQKDGGANPDAGTPPGGNERVVLGCGCSAPPSGFLTCLLGLLLLHCPRRALQSARAKARLPSAYRPSITR